MGEVYVEAILTSNGHQVRRRLLVDTGATFSWIHERHLKALGVKPVDSDTFETIEGKRTRRRRGIVEVEILGRRAPTMVAFARPSDSEVLGLHALEGLRLEVDPVGRRLKRCRAVKALTLRRGP